MEVGDQKILIICTKLSERKGLLLYLNVLRWWNPKNTRNYEAQTFKDSFEIRSTGPPTSFY